LGCGSAIAKRCCKQFPFWDVGSAIAKRSAGIAFEMWGCDSKALLQAVRCLGLWGSAIAKRCCKQFAVWVCGDAIAFGVRNVG